MTQLIVPLLLVSYSILCIDGVEYMGLCSKMTASWYRDHCYWIRRDKITWENARRNCEQRLSDLIVISDEDENIKITQWYAQHTNDTGVWTGYHYNTSTQLWQWTTDSESIYENWDEGEPNIQNGHCAVVDGLTGLWSAQNCTGSMRYTCEARSPHYKTRGWYVIGEKMYLIPFLSLNFEKSKEVCVSLGATLAVVQNDEENMNILAAGRTANKYIYQGSRDTAYIGYYRKNRSLKSWTWVDSSETSTYTNFSADLILDDTKLCTILNFIDGSWKMSRCTATGLFVCEKGVEWQYFNATRYGIIRNTDSFERHYDRCAGMNANILEINSEDENNFIRNIVNVETPDVIEFFLNYRYSPEDRKWYGGPSHQVEITYDKFINDYHRYPPDGITRNCSTIVPTEYHKDDIGKWVSRYSHFVTHLACSSTHQHIEVVWNGKTYSFLESPLKWTLAERRCSQLGLNMVTIDSPQEALFVARTLRRRYRIHYHKVWLAGILPSVSTNFVWTTTERDISWSDLRSIDHLTRLRDYCINMSLKGRSITLSYSSCEKTRIVVCESQESMFTTFHKNQQSKLGVTISNVTPPVGFVPCSAACTAAVGCVAFNFISTTRRCELLSSLQSTDDLRDSLQQYERRYPT